MVARSILLTVAWILLATAQDTPPQPLVCSPLEKGIAYRGYNLANTTRSTPEECCEDCKATPGCTVFVFQKNTCKLKTNAGETRHVKCAISSFVIPKTPEPTDPPVTDRPTPTPDTCGCVGGDLCSKEGRCDACNMNTPNGRICEDRFFSTCRWFSHTWCGEQQEPPPPPINPIGRCECKAGHKCDTVKGQCHHCNYPRLSAGYGQDGICEDWERNACLHTFGGQWCS